MKRIVLLLLLAAGVFMSGCGSDNDDFVLQGNVAAPQGFLRFAHLSPDAPNVDIRVDGQLIANNVPFRTLSRYVGFLVGTRRVQIFPAGGNNAVIDANVTVTQNTFQTVAATNLVANIAPAVFQDTVTNATGNALLRVIHGSPDAGAVDLTLADGTVLAGNLTFPNATAYLPVAPGTYNLQLRVAGTQNIVRDFPGVQVAAGQTLSAIAVGQLVDQSLDVIVAVDDANDGSATLNLAESLTTFRVAHLSPDAGAVDITVDGINVGTNVTFPAVANYATTPTRSNVVVRVFAAGTQNQVLTTTQNLTANTAITVAATGSVQDANLALTLYTDDRQGTNGVAEVRAVHASPNAPAVNVTADATNLVAGATFPNAGPYVNVNPNANATITVTANNNPVLQAANQNLVAGRTYSAFVIGRVGVNLQLLLTQDSP